MQFYDFANEAGRQSRGLSVLAELLLVPTALIGAIRPIETFCVDRSALGRTKFYNVQGGPAKVRPTYIFDGNISMHK